MAFRLAVLLAIIGIGAWLRFAHLDNHAVTVDEISTLELASMSPGDIVTSLRLQGPDTSIGDYSPPLYHLLLHGFLLLAKTDFAARLPGILLGIATILLLYKVTRDLFTPRAGVMAAVICALSCFMIHYSRNIRPFSLLVLLSLAAVHYFWAAVHDRKPAAWIPFTMISAAAMYTSYAYSLCLCSIGLYTAASGLLDRARQARPWPWRTWLAFGASGLAIVALYLPWLQAYLNLAKLTYVQFPPTGFPGSPFRFVVDTFRDFVSYGGGSAPYFLLALALLLLGCYRAWRLGRLAALALLFLIGLFPLAVYYAMGSSHPYYSRHIINFYFFVTIGIALGLDAILAWLFAEKRRALALAAGVLLAAGYSLPTFHRLDTYYRSGTSDYKDEALRIYLEKYNCTRFDSFSPITMNFITDWYLPGAYRSLSTVDDQKYNRLLYVDLKPELLVTPHALSQSVDRYKSMFFHRIGLVNASPIVPRPGPDETFVYTESFKTFQMYTQARRWDNIELNRADGNVGGHEPGRTGTLEYVFDLAGLEITGDAVLTVSYTYRKHVLADSEDHCRIALAVDGGPDAPLLDLDARDFQGLLGKQTAEFANYTVTRTLSLEARRLHNASTLAIRFGFAPDMTLSAIRLSGFSLRLHGRPAPGTPDPAERTFAHIRQNTPLAPWPQAASYPQEPPLTAFALTEAANTAAGVGSPEALREFLRQHPGLRPVLEVADASGRPRYALYDPFLDAVTPRISAPGDYPLLFPGQAEPGAAMCEARGSMRYPRLSLGDTPLPLSLWLPKGSLLHAAAGSPVTALFLPDFRAPAFDPGQFFLAERTRQNGAEPCLRCQDGRDCWFAYLFASAAPLTELRLTYFPRLMQDPLGENRITVECSEDFKAFRTVDVYRGDGSGSWSPLGVARTLRLPLGPSTRQMWIRFTLTSESCQVWAAPEYPTSMLATVKGPTLGPIPAGATRTALRAAFDEPNDFTLRLSGQSGPFPTSLLRVY